MASPSGLAIFLIVWGQGKDATATFHLKTVEHGTAVHHIQHGTTGLQAGEDLEDKGHARPGSECQVRTGGGAWEQPEGVAI